MEAKKMMRTRIYPPAMQARGGFDGGRITEQKPIGFPGEGSVIKRVGPLFYWAWAHAPESGYIPLHPHSGFEIMTYVIQGRSEHGDSLGTRSVVGPGGAQIMQTGSGVSHEEGFVGPDMEGFQIWFEPDLQEAVKRPPAYRQFGHEQFPLEEKDGVQVKTVLGEGSPVSLVTDARMWDIRLEPGKAWSYTIPAGRAAAALAVRGGGEWADGHDDGARHAFSPRDFILLEADETLETVVRAFGDAELRMIVIEVPSRVDYRLYPKR
jgi:hypothetical protein